MNKRAVDMYMYHIYVCYTVVCVDIKNRDAGLSLFISMSFAPCVEAVKREREQRERESEGVYIM